MVYLSLATPGGAIKGTSCFREQNSGSTSIHLQVCSCWAVLWMCCQPLAGASSRLPVSSKRAMLECNLNKPQVIRAELIHRDHPESQLREPRGATAADRRAAAASRDWARITRRRLGAGLEFATPLSSAVAFGDAAYVITLYFGTPGQKFTLIADTGSDLVWIQCLPCSAPYLCFSETDPFFNTSASSSYAAVPCNNLSCDPHLLFSDAYCNLAENCQINYSYGEPGSGISGVLSTETISFSNATQGQLGISNILFGCMDNDTATFGTVDGLVGFGRGPFSLPSQLSQLTSVNIFSYCLIPFQDATNLTSTLLFGASNSNGLQLEFTPIVNNPDILTYYWVNMTGISINGTAVNIPQAPLAWNSTSFAGGTIFDSGTTFTVFSQDIYAPVVQSLQALITYPIVPDPTNSSLCYNISGLQQPQYPSMKLQFSGVDGCSTVDFHIKGKNLFILNSTDVNCLAIVSAGVPFLGPNIIGNVAQGDHYIQTDLGNMKIGWTSRDCSHPL